MITLSNEEIEILKNSDFDSKAYITEATDNYDDLTINDVEIESKVNTKEIGDYTITYTLIDSNNNIGTASLIVHVVEKIEKMKMMMIPNKKQIIPIIKTITKHQIIIRIIPIAQILILNPSLIVYPYLHLQPDIPI